jgi:L-ascorbate oxidase
MIGAQRALLLVAAVLGFIAVVQGATVTYDWDIDYSWQAPDCVEKLIIAANNVYPGPPIRATAGDTVVVNVKNSMPTEGVVIHWHGIEQVFTFLPEHCSEMS